MYLRFLDDLETTYNIEGQVNHFIEDKLCIYQADIPENTSGFELVMDNDEVIPYHNFTVIYSKTDDYIIFTSDTRYHFIYYIFDDNGFIISYLTSVKESERPDTIMARCGIGSQYEICQIDEFLDEEFLPKLKVVDGEIVSTTEEDRLFVKNKKLQTVKDEMILLSKAQLTQFLENYPLISSCHGGQECKYSVTLEKQNLMMSQYMTYQIEKTINPEAVLTWNESGEECEVWTEEEFLQLVLEVKQYVYPMVSYQQVLEKNINACTEMDELNNIMIDFNQFLK